MPDLQLLKSISFGSRVAEDESEVLGSYFVETAQWQQLTSGAVDIVYGPKGSGKSALYSLLLKRIGEFFDRAIILIPAENPRGGAAFEGLKQDPPSSEIEFLSMWKLYFVILLADALSDYSINNLSSEQLNKILEAAGLKKKAGANLGSIVRSVVNYVRNVKAIETTIGLDSSGAPVLGGKISLGEPDEKQRRAGVQSIDDLLTMADEAWKDSGYKAWLLLDRLDVAFADSSELEENALRALFKTYLDLNNRNNFRLKIFLRSDIWKRLTAKGFREASHIVREITIQWDRQSLLNLIVKRTLGNGGVRLFYSIDESNTPISYGEQVEFFERAFPEQIDLGARKPKTIDWILTRTMDGTRASAPREIIHLLTAARDSQIHLLELGETDDGPYLIGRRPFKDGLVEVSKVRVEKTIYAEYPRLMERISQLEGEKSEQRPETLATIWNTSVDDARAIAGELLEVGFFEARGSKQEPQYWVPFLYRDALNLVQGVAASEADDD